MKEKEKAAKTAADQAAGKSSTAGTGSSGTTKSAGQESAESLLSSLNTKMDQLIKYSAQTTTNTYEQVNATKGLSGNVLVTA